MPPITASAPATLPVPPTAASSRASAAPTRPALLPSASRFPVGTRDYAALSREMESWTPQQILRWAAEEFGGGLAFATAFGVEGCVLLSMMATIPAYRERVFLFNLDTGYQFPETLALRETIQRKYDLNVRLVSAAETVAEMERRLHGPIYGTDPQECCRMRKLVPLRDALAGRKAWISSIRRDQSTTRADAPIIDWDPKFQMVKINPLANWTRSKVWGYALEQDVPYNPLHDEGFASIGCQPCTQAVGAGQDERAGRWAKFGGKTECGIHVAGARI